MIKILSYFAAICLGLLAVAPMINYNIPLIVNSFGWLYGVVVAALMGMFLLSKKMPLAFKVLVVYLWLTCFISFVPYLSFNAYILIVASLYFFLIFKLCDYEIILNMAVAVFWVQIFFGTMQLFGVDTLTSFDQAQNIFFGTIRQYMRFASHLAILAPLLVIKNKWYIIPLIILAIIIQSSSFAFAIIGGIAVYFILKNRKYMIHVIALSILCVGLYCIYDWDSVQASLTFGRLSVWGDVIRTWAFDTRACAIPVSKNYITCPIDWKSIFFGRGIDTFLPLFPVFKHDPNPFPQAHNSFLQFIWEIGLIGFGIICVYVVNLFKRCCKHKEHLLVAGLVCIGINMFFAFPERLTQNWLIIICYLALCEKKGGILCET